MAMDSVDVWADRKLFLLEEDGSQQHVAGSPPDNFSKEGQKWGNPVYDYSYMEEHQFDWWRHRIEKNAALYDVIRIDHFLGVVRYYTIPFREIPDALIRLAYSSIADVVIIPMQDILQLGNEARMNQPSTVGQNWKWRVGKDTLSEERRAWIRTIAAVYRR